jgi:glucose-6-phosphate 1-epimerase
MEHSIYFQNLDALNAAHSLRDQLRFVQGPGGFPFIEVRNTHAAATVSLYGGQVLSFQPREACADALFVSEQALYATGKAIRGGVPICWPWFGPDPEGLRRSAHGFARTQLWTVHGTAAMATGATRITLGLADSEQTRAIWPHGFALTLEITVGPTLCLALTTRNTGVQPFAITQALHSYFDVGDVAQTTVSGLDKCRYIDKAAGANGAAKTQQGEVHFEAEVDRIYANPPAELTVLDSAGQRAIHIASTGSRTAVVWNPWAQIAAGMSDLKDDAFQRFVCVETANAGDDVVTVSPGKAHRLTAEISVQRHAN